MDPKPPALRPPRVPLPLWVLSAPSPASGLLPSDKPTVLALALIQRLRMATAAAGPLRILLHNAAGQYVLLGVGAYALFPEKFHKMLEYSPALMNLVSGASAKGDKKGSSGPSPIIIHTPSPTVIGGNGGRTWAGTIAYTAAGATACWAGYVVLVELLPESVGQFLPVTRSIFDKTSASLGKGILKCKTVLEEKIKELSGQQEELGRKQDATNSTVSHIKGELGEARMDLSYLQSSLDRCETSLENSEGMHQFTARGVRLLVRCVANLMPDNQETAHELARFIEEEQQQLALEQGRTAAAASEGSGAVSGEMQTPSATPRTRRAHTTPTTRKSNGIDTRTLSSTKKALPMTDGDLSDGEGTFNDIRALLGH